MSKPEPSFVDEIIEGLTPVEATPEATPPVAATPAEPTPTPAPIPAPQAPAPAELPKAQEVIPFATALDWRDKLKATQRELEELKAKSAAAPAVPTLQTDPEGFAQYLAEQNQRIATSTRFEVSEVMAREKHGEDTVTQAMDWAMKKAESSPAFALEYIKQKHPIDWAVRQQKRDTTFNEIGDDVDSYIAKNAERLGFVKAAPSQAPVGGTPQPAALAPAQPAPTRSLASAPAAGGGQTSVPSNPVAAVEALFG